jgi:hypothetical protein
MGKIVFCLSALVCLLVRAGACFVFGFNFLSWVLQALVATARRHRLTAPPHGVMEVSSDGAATACACGGLQG